MQTDTRERRRKEIASAQTPQHRSRNARENAGDEERRDAGILAGRTGFDHFMQMAARKPAFRQVPIDRRNAERQHLALLTPMPFPCAQDGGATRQ